ncbi:MAG TPA: tRNA (guanosine(37)-N1)-methyltransferase TrmD [bacterium]|nr:tRNA (guanosine(37)-N1)-methyltransferase TrmD [bacterium]HNS34088.1 tRNA (guanosine(37)-N1)-methyltransferase TrmD [bacterium]HNW09093.1 tRNA (guanosine(37)-N1)-methyltransferase TrmD [bacterium]HNZ73591.1 tRNA (guanosine(37)-N1)-methyltransferase TrmD [bacterium]HOH67205.1 tRNA (guanosine(37)-N1)-methyltransferase TrmD [bacterium]
MKQFDIITIFPEILGSYFNESLFKRAQKNKLLKIKTHNLRKWTKDRHQTVDDRPYGGGVGLLFKVEPIYKALKTVAGKPYILKKEGVGGRSKKTRIILTAANGKKFTQADAKRLSKYDQLIFVCPRYEGVDARVEKFVDEKISIGDYVLAGGELAAAVIVEAVSRYLPGFVGKDESVKNDSFSQKDYLEHPHYTRPEVFVADGKKLRVPKVLISGHHGEIAKWRKKKSRKTKSII